MTEPAPALVELSAYLKHHPETAWIDAVFADLCGVVRGKRLPVDKAETLFRDGLAMPGSVFLLDALGESHDPRGRGFTDGDPDHLGRVVPGSLKPVPWLGPPSGQSPIAQVLLNFFEHGGEPYAFQPRNVLARVIERFAELGLKPVVAFELEFYLIDPERGPGGAPRPPVSPLTGIRESGTQVYAMSGVDSFGPLLAEIQEACVQQQVPAGTITTEYAPGQFEINLMHVDDPLLAADHCVLFKRAVKGVARKHGLQATFMAKPQLEQAGSGLHLHISLVDEAGRNVFDGGAQVASETLRQAIGGILATLPEAMGILAPNPNSFRRFQPNIFVPIKRCWGFENRSLALRIPSGKPAARRIEHRVAGADANPYLTLATALAGIHHGITEALDPGPPAEGNAGDAYDAGLAFRPRRALEATESAVVLAGYLGAEYLATYAACKHAELDRFEAVITPNEYRWYLQAD